MMQILELFPAYAGVILVQTSGQQTENAFPRIRGGDPMRLSFRIFIFFFSPHTRG